MESPRTKFQTLLRELFQFDCADLDFGIYRIMNLKRDVIERFIEHDLLDGVAEELNRGALAAQSDSARTLEEARERVRTQLGEETLLPDGELKPEFHGTPAGSEYLRAREAASGAKGRDALEATIFNHLYSFFSRYYDNGDFISKRRYSKRERYAIPYNGEEVYLHWANKDQYYVKTTEQFRDYTYKHRDVTVHFKVKEADVEQDNVKGDKRYFLPRIDEAAYDEASRELLVPFEYRPLTEQEAITYGKKDQQVKINAEAGERLPPKFEGAPAVLLALTAEWRRHPEDEPIPLVAHHLRRYTAKNTSDYFIHKDLRGFLTRELDFYLKNEVLLLADVEAGGEGRAEGWFQMMQVVRAIGSRVIAFLAQIEDFQKRLFEKRKFITEVNYLITVGNIPPEFYPEIAANDAQWDEWKALFHIDEEQHSLFSSGNRASRRTQFLQSHPTLVVDTKRFPEDFVDRLLAVRDLHDPGLDGLLIFGENFASTALCRPGYAGCVQCLYFDPPFNTSEETFLYKNEYKHSSWMAMMDARLRLSRALLSGDGVCLVAIDDEECTHIRAALDQAYGPDNFMGAVIIQINPRGRTINTFFATTHEYLLVYGADRGQAGICDRPLTPEQAAQFNKRDDVSDYRLLPFRRSGGLSTPEERPNSEYPIFYDLTTGRIDVERFEGAVEIMPVDSGGRRRVWRQTKPSLMKAVHAGDIVIRANAGGYVVYMKDRIKEGRKPKTMWVDSSYDASTHGTVLLQDILGDRNLFTYPKSIHTVYDSIHTVVADNQDALVVDLFAGSGTTGHAVIVMNRSDGGHRRFILVEMGGYFDSVLLPRTKKVIFTPEWKDGKPARPASAEEVERSPRMVKYIRLESFEDALNNISYSGAGGQQAMQFDDYLLDYMLDAETQGSEALLNVERLAEPFSYKLRIYDDGETRKKPVDLAETFNYLIGLQVKTRRVYHDDGRRYLVYRGTADEKDTVVIWRECKDWGLEQFERDRQFVDEQQMADGAEVVYVNCDSRIPSARSLDPEFKRLMFALLEV